MESLMYSAIRQNDKDLSKRIAAQRAARLALGPKPELEKKKCTHRSAPNFFDNIDTSGGIDACHPWTGSRKINHTEAGGEHIQSYEHGVFRYDGCNSWIATRVLCFAIFGREPPKDMDITPLCGDHLCMNLRHLCVTPHGGSSPNKLNKATPVEEFFAT